MLVFPEYPPIRPALPPCRRWTIFLVLAVCFSAICAPPTIAAAADGNNEGDGSGFSWRGVVPDFVYAVKSPLRMSKTGGLKTVVLAGITAGFIAGWDEDVDEEGRRRPHRFPYILVRELSELGHEFGRNDMRPVFFCTGLAGSMLAGGLVLDDDKLLTTAALMTESFAFAVLAVSVVKMTVGRERPYRDNGAREFEYFKFSSDRSRRSMPSGHTASAFAMMTTIAKRYPTWWIRVPAYTAALGAGLQRIDSRKHWTSDAIVGAVVGYTVASAVVERHSNGGTGRTAMTPLVSPGRVGVVFRF